MTLQQFAKLRKLRISQLKELAIELFGTIPEEFTEKQIADLDNAIARASASLLPAQSEDLILSTDPNESNERIVKIVGEKLIKENLQLYLRNAKKHYLAQQFEIDTLHFQIEQGFYSNLSSYQQKSQSESIGRMNRNSQSFTRQGIESFKADSNLEQSESDVLNDISELMDFFLIA
jgi:hypothetical protein